jgi:hypothetical protein
MDMVGYGTRPRGFAALQMALARLAARTGMGGGFMGAPMMPYNPMMMWDPAMAQQGMMGMNPYYQTQMPAGVDPAQAWLAMLSQAGFDPSLMWGGVSDTSGTSGSSSTSLGSSSTSGTSGSSSSSFSF